MTVFLVDDDPSSLEAWTAELRLRGLSTVNLSSANAAWRTLRDVQSTAVGLVVIDVMLTVEDLADPRFSVERTAAYLETGLRLLDDLAEQNPAVFPWRAVLLSSTVHYEILRNVRATASRHGIPFWPKSQIMSPFDFGDRVTGRIAELG